MSEYATTPEVLALLRGPSRAYMSVVDRPLVRRMGATSFGLIAICSLVVMAFAEPTALLGPVAGWVLGGSYVLVAAGASISLLRARRTPLLGIYLTSLGLLAGLGLVGWLAQDGDLFASLPLLVLIVVAAVFPARQVALAVAVAFVAQVPALVAVGMDSHSVVELLLQAFTWVCLSALALVWSAGMRAQGMAMHAHARVDALTGLGNRRAFDEALATELARAVRSERPLSLLVGDLDGFKAINDRHGHLVGDACLREVGAVVRDLTRRPDSCFRWGGDEFAVLLPDAEAPRARAVAERLAAAVATACRTPDGTRLSVAFGVAERSPGEADPATLLARADRDLMVVKTGAGAPGAV